MYQPKDRKTQTLFPELFPFGGSLDKENRWLKLAEAVPWEEMENTYRRFFSADSGRPATDARLVCGLLIVKHVEKFSDQRTLNELAENPYVQAFCGFERFITEKDLVGPKLLSQMRGRLGREFFDKFEEEVVSLLIRKKLLGGLNFEYPAGKNPLRTAARWILDKLSRVF